MAIRFRSGAAMPGGLQCFTDDRGPVGSVFGQGLAGPVAGDQDTTAADAEVFSIMSLGTAAGAGPVALDAVAQPVRAPRRAGQPAQLGVQPVDVRLPRWV